MISTRLLALATILTIGCAAEGLAQVQTVTQAAPALAALDAINDKEWLAQPNPALLSRVIAASSKAALDEAAKSDPRAQTLVGTGYVLGLSGYPQSDADAAKFYRLGASTNAIAQNNLGILLENGRADSGGEAPAAAAAKYYRLAALQGHILAGANLGRCLARGTGVAQDFKEAIRWLTPAANNGVAQAQEELASLYESGFGFERDDAKAAKLYKLAADQGNADALSRIAEMAFMDLIKKDVYEPDARTQQLFAKAFAAYQRDAAGGSVHAMHRLGEMYHLGQGVPRDSGAALANFRKAAVHGDVNAQVQIGRMAESGDGVTKNEAMAARIYNECAKKGDRQALTYLARMIETGRGGLKQDKAEAIRLYRMADQRGDSEAFDDLRRLGLVQ